MVSFPLDLSSVNPLLFPTELQPFYLFPTLNKQDDG